MGRRRRSTWSSSTTRTAAFCGTDATRDRLRSASRQARRVLRPRRPDASSSSALRGSASSQLEERSALRSAGFKPVRTLAETRRLPIRRGAQRMISFANKVAIVTGASSGIGRATALALAAHGAHGRAVGRDAQRARRRGRRVHARWRASNRDRRRPDVATRAQARSSGTRSRGSAASTSWSTPPAIIAMGTTDATSQTSCGISVMA